MTNPSQGLVGRVRDQNGDETLKFKHIWVRSRNYGCLVTWFCYQLIAKPGNKTVAVSWPDPYNHIFHYIGEILFVCLLVFNIKGFLWNSKQHIPPLYQKLRMSYRGQMAPGQMKWYDIWQQNWSFLWSHFSPKSPNRDIIYCLSIWFYTTKAWDIIKYSKIKITFLGIDLFLS